MDPPLPVLDLVTLDSAMSSQGSACCGLAMPVYGLVCSGSATPVFDFAHFGSVTSIRSASRVELALFIYGIT